MESALACAALLGRAAGLPAFDMQSRDGLRRLRGELLQTFQFCRDRRLRRLRRLGLCFAAHSRGWRRRGRILRHQDCWSCHENENYNIGRGFHLHLTIEDEMGLKQVLV